MRGRPSRRGLLIAGGGFLAGAAFGPIAFAAAEVIEIRMRGALDGSRAWFDPIGVLARPGQTIRWLCADPANAHTATAYHPANDGRALRIPSGAAPWHSDYLLDGETFETRLTAEGVYDYCCVPHEHAGMVGRIVVGRPTDVAPAAEGVPEAALAAFPPVDEIMARGILRPPA